ncbi:hypothetical protein CNYM01_13052 [Colletotrichum nymphaeae SA-01]|uniref:Uncharacterized protein n=1 Tax=Colletotrichum nymphaeae SA-01 TaxID=1460502 RepID=A0A135TK88_9PEZI|nr:hypothetical protein CNYM01_13052 [Colletotrichum nymphaeae SA-01]
MLSRPCIPRYIILNPVLDEPGRILLWMQDVSNASSTSGGVSPFACFEGHALSDGLHHRPATRENAIVVVRAPRVACCALCEAFVSHGLFDQPGFVHRKGSCWVRWAWETIFIDKRPTDTNHEGIALGHGVPLEGRNKFAYLVVRVQAFPSTPLRRLVNKTRRPHHQDSEDGGDASADVCIVHWVHEFANSPLLVCVQNLAVRQCVQDWSLLRAELHDGQFVPVSYQRTLAV